MGSVMITKLYGHHKPESPGSNSGYLISFPLGNWTISTPLTKRQEFIAQMESRRKLGIFSAYIARKDTNFQM